MMYLLLYQQIELEASILTPNEANSVEEQVVYEYQRWEPVIGWGPSLLPTDPGRYFPIPVQWFYNDVLFRWSAAGGTRFEKEFDAIIPPIPDGWVVNKPWGTVSTSRDPEGWQYADSFYSTDWHTTEMSGCK